MGLPCDGRSAQRRGACGWEAAYRDCVAVYNRMVAYEQRYSRAFLILLGPREVSFSLILGEFYEFMLPEIVLGLT